MKLPRGRGPWAFAAALALAAAPADGAEQAKPALRGLPEAIAEGLDENALGRLFEGSSAWTAQAAPVPPLSVAGAALTPHTWTNDGATVPKPRPKRTAAGASVPLPRLSSALGARTELVGMAVAEARRQGADPLLVLALVKQESNFDPGAKSPAGAKGLMQLMPKTAAAVGVSPGRLFDPRANLQAGIRYLKTLWDEFARVRFSQLGSVNPRSRPDVQNAVAAYNAGPGAVQRHGGVPPYPETRGYVDKVLGYYERLKRLLSR